MKFIPKTYSLYLLVSIGIITSCQKNKQSPVPNYIPTPPPPSPITYPNPIARAGADQVVVLPVTPGAIWPIGSLMLNGSLSEPAQNILSYNWSQISGPNQSNFQSSTSISILGNLIEGHYSFELRVIDGQGRTAKDTVNYHVIHDTLGGKEFFYNETWHYYSPEEDIYTVITDSSVFYAASRIIEVNLQLDGTSNWISIPFWNWYFASPGQAFYFLTMGDTLLIENYSSDHQLINKPVRVKVKFS